jgi:hypothetical protein
MMQHRARSLQQQPQSQLAAWCVDCEDCGGRERHERCERCERGGSDREGRGAEVAVGEVGLKLRAWWRGSALLDSVVYLIDSGKGGERR